MAKQVEKRTFGVDVAKAWLDIYGSGSDAVVRIENTASAIDAWLRTEPGPARMAVEATNRFHEAFVACAQVRGHEVYLVDALKLCRYREAVGRRAKTDRHDAVLLARYVQQEQAELRRWCPPDPQQSKLWRLLKRRATLVQTTVRLRQSLTDLGELDRTARDLIDHCRQLIRQVDRKLQQQARDLGWGRDLQRSRGIPGVGPLTALALVATYHRHDFRNADAFVAFMGLDVRVRDSGTFRGRRKLTKKGDPELRRLLYNAAMAACRQPHWASYYRSLRDRGLSGTAALVALSRKLVRVCYALLRQQAAFNPDLRNRACAAT